MSTIILYGVLPIVVGLLIGYVLFQLPSKKLKERVEKNKENFSGKSKSEIIKLLGVNPEKEEFLDNGCVCTFGAGNFYNIRIEFDNNDIFVKIVSERNSNYSIRGNN